MRTSIERSPARRARTAVLAVALAAAVLGGPVLAARPPPSDGAPAAVRLLEVNGIVSPFTARYLLRELRRAEERGDGAVVVRLDTPGGLLAATRTTTQAMLAARVPVIVYVAPSGARAASAGKFLLIAGHVAAMAPGTHVGAAHAVRPGGHLREVMTEEVVNDVAALARALATARGRDAEWAEEAVRRSISATADEAEGRGVVDTVAPDLDALLLGLHGKTVVTAAGATRLETRNAPRERIGMSLPERLLQAVVRPDIAYLLFTLGLIGTAATLHSPALLFPGIAGVIALVLALAGFGVLPVSSAGIALIAAGVALVGVGVSTQGISLVGVVAFVAGSLLLYGPTDPAAPALADLRVSGWLIATMAGTLAGIFLLVRRSVRLTRSRSSAQSRRVAPEHATWRARRHR